MTEPDHSAETAREARNGRVPDGDIPADPTALVTQVSHQSMATNFVVMLAANCSDGVETALQALEQLDEIEADLTVYREDSEVSRVNQRAAAEPTRVNQSTFRLLKRAIHWSGATGGAFDVTAGPLVDAWGFTARSGKKPTNAEIEAAMEKCGYKNLIVDDQAQTISFARSGMKINLGAIGKGDAIDRLASDLKSASIHDFLIHGGQSSVLASGDQTPGSGNGWAVGIAHPTKPKKRIAGVWLRDAAIGTSGSGKQFFHHRGQRFGHVIDPRTGYPASDLMSLTVVTPSAADADALATGLFVAGSAEASRFQQATEAATPDGVAVKGVPMLMASPGKRQDETLVRTAGEFNWVRGDRPAVRA